MKKRFDQISDCAKTSVSHMAAIGYICASLLFTVYCGLMGYLGYDARRHGRI